MACYVIGHVRVDNMDGYRKYTAQVPATIAAHGGEFLVRGGDCTVLEGEMPRDRHVTIRFPDRAAAEAWYNSPEYQAILPIRQANSDGIIMLVDGVAP